MGLVNWYREYVPGVSELADPLHRLTRKDTVWDWTSECQASFEILKNRLTQESHVLVFPRWDEPFYLETDASSSAIGAVLSQKGQDGKKNPLEFYSAGLNPAQSKYAAGELETWAIVAAIRKWRTYLRAAKRIVIITDHNPLTWLRRQKDPRNKFARWLLELESYDYTIEYRQGAENGAADYLSRLPTRRDIEIENEEEHFERFVYLLEDEIVPLQAKLTGEQLAEHTIHRAIEQLKEGGRIVSGPYRLQEGMRLDGGGRLCRKEAVVIPRTLQKEITAVAHRLTHAGIQKSTKYIRDRFFWFKMNRTIEDYCQACDVCVQNKRRAHRREPLTPMRMETHEPRCTIAADIATLPWSSGGYRYLLTIVDLFSKLVEIVPMYVQTAESVREAPKVGWIYRHGVPKVLLTDQGNNVDGNAIRELCVKYGITKKRSSPYHPAGDGEAERAIQSIKQALRCQLSDQESGKTDWPSVLQQAAFAHNSLQNASTKFSPHELMYGTKLRSLADVIAEVGPNHHESNNGLDLTKDIPKPPTEKWKQAECNIEQAKETYKHFHDNRAASSPTFMEKGETVYLRNFTREDGLDPMYLGPYRVVDFRHPNVKVEKEKGKSSWIHVDNCKVMPRELTEHLVPSDGRPSDHENVHETERREIDGTALISEQPITKGDEPLRRSTRQKRKPNRFEET